MASETSMTSMSTVSLLSILATFDSLLPLPAVASTFLLALCLVCTDNDGVCTMAFVVMMPLLLPICDK